MLMGLGSGRLAFGDFYQAPLPDYPMGTPAAGLPMGS